METISSDEFRIQISDVIKRATKELCQFRVTSPQGTVVLLPEETYNHLIVTLELLSTPGLMEMMDTKNNSNS